MLKKLKELWIKFDTWMMMYPGSNPYIWDWWELVKNPLAWIVVFVFALFVFATVEQPQPQPQRETITLIYENGKHIIIK